MLGQGLRAWVSACPPKVATAQPGEAGSSQLADWFWEETVDDKLLLELKESCLK